MDEIVREFLIESHENLDTLDRELVELERNPGATETLGSIFRTIHTIKGTCGFLGFGKLESITHVGENLLSKLRDGELTLDQEITDALLALIDAVRGILAAIEATEAEGDGEYGELVAELSRLQEPPAAGEPQEPPAPPDAAAGPEARPAAEDAAATLVEVEEDGAALAETDLSPQPSPSAAEPADSPAAAGAAGPAEARSTVIDSIRVDVSLLDKLMNLVGELVLARNQILQYSSQQEDAAFMGTSQRLNLVTTELQEGVMKTRMQPIDNVWGKFPRVVRDLAAACDKHVRLEMEGRDTELDKTVLEAIKDPLTHLVRNSVDHGIESPADREAAGKPREGRLLLRAFHESGLVNIEITDDGSGIDTERVRALAVERGVVTQEQAGRMSDREVTNLIFLPGFSTADKVTNVSGRGVGMDVVRTNIERIGGTLDIQSTVGAGTTLKIKIPLTLAIIPALILNSGSECYAIPQVSLLELVRLEGDPARNGVETIHGSPVYRLRGKLLPLVYLREALGARGREPGDSPAAGPLGSADDGQENLVNIVVLQADDQQFGLVVEGIEDTAEIVVKPLGKQLKGIPIFAGATIMGDGRVALIIDVIGVAHRAKVIGELHDKSLAAMGADVEGGVSDAASMLLAEVGDGKRVAIPLAGVARLEQFPLAKVEWAGSQQVVQYTGRLLPIVSVAGALGAGMSDQRDPADVVVVWRDRHQVGLEVGRIVDIVDDVTDSPNPSSKHGVVGSLVIQGRVTDVIDLDALIAQVDVALFEQGDRETAGV